MHPAPQERSLPDRASNNTDSAMALIPFVLLIIGGLNWGLVGLFNFDLVAFLFGSMSIASRAVYVLVGLSALAALPLLPRVSRPA